jgi:hypothetical protein
LLSACTQWRYELGEPLSASQAPDASQSPALADVLAQLGPPQRLSAIDGGYVLAWEHWQIRESSLGFSLGSLGVDILSVDWGDARVEGEFLLLTFNRGHQLTASTFSRWDADAGSGAALQPLFGLVSVVDVDDLVRRMPQHDWGAAALKRLPEALNTPSRPDMGQAGIEQRGTPTGIGQQSLEMK